MNKFISRLLLLFSFFLCTLSVIGAEKERIMSFHSDIVIAETGKITVSESIKVYAAGNDIERGIIRNLPLYRTDNTGMKQRMDIDVLTVMRDGISEPFHTKKNGGDLEIFIGDENYKLPTGTYTYSIVYESYGQIGFFDDYDELYWNVTGNEWVFNIEHASATIQLPDSTKSIQAACYTGKYGSTSKNCDFNVKNNNVFLETQSPLSPGSGFTIAASFTRDIIRRPPPPGPIEALWNKYKEPFCALFFWLILGTYCFLTWLKAGRDPRKALVVPTFNPPNGWEAAVCRYIYSKGYDNKVFTTAIISMAIENFIRIRHKNKKFSLEKTDKYPSGEKYQLIYDTLFKNGNKKIAVSDENHEVFSQAIKEHTQAILEEYNIKEYFLHNLKYAFGALVLAVLLNTLYFFISDLLEADMLLFVLCAVFSFFGAWFLMTVVQNKHLDGLAKVIFVILGVFFLSISITIFVLVNDFHLSYLYVFAVNILLIIYFAVISAPTEKGTKVYAELEGFRMYLKTAEENRLNQLTPPEHTPELFEKMLPYAIALGVENQWGRKFDNVLAKANYKPQWYDDTRPFKHALLASYLSSEFNQSVSQARFDSSGGSSGSRGWSAGSGGGGFSGGGGGGGGGRGW